MNTEIKEYINQCEQSLEQCNMYQTKQQKEPDVPDNPWEKVGNDILTYNGKEYFCSVDYYYDYIELDKLNSKNTQSIIKRHFAKHFIPQIVQSDNGPPFNSVEFCTFAD